jgi:hypothetical protein
VIPAFVSAGHFWCLVFDGAVKALCWFSCKNQEVLCGEDPDRTANSFWDSGTMIHIIGTAHSVQCWSDAIKSGIDCDADPTTVKRFERYLHDAALLLGVTAIAEELSQKAVEQRRGGSSVAKEVARRLGLRHFFCDPDRDEREALGVSTGVDREAVWASRLEPLSPNETSMIFLCGANHSDTFKRTLERRGLDARIHCDDWTLLKA